MNSPPRCQPGSRYAPWWIGPLAWLWILLCAGVLLHFLVNPGPQQ